jgi:nitric oxide reductase subunit B
MRVPGDTIFSIGALAMAWFVLRLWIGPKHVTTRAPGAAPLPAAEQVRSLPR